MDAITKGGKARSEGKSVQEIMKEERVTPPPHLLEENYTYVGSDPLPVDRYISQEFLERENQTVWKKTWQMACRLEEIPNVGDHVIYDINDDSLIVVRTAPETIRAYHNSCLHRGRRLRDQGGNISQLRCPYHAFTWNLQGKSVFIPCKWDFSHIDQENFNLPEAKVGTWGGFVFINFDPECEPLESYLHPIPEHFKDWNYENKVKVAHVGKVCNFNWKVGVEAFIESFHVIATHPQILPTTGDANTQYDNYEGSPVNRMITPFGVHSPHIEQPPEQEIVKAMSAGVRRKFGPAADKLLNIPEGVTARRFMADLARRTVSAESGLDLSHATDSEMLDALQYFVFPNFFPWGGYGSNIVYRFRPARRSPDWCLMEVILINNPPKDQPRPAPAKMRLLGDDERWADAEPQLSSLAAVFEQDFGNMPSVQRGLKASKTGVVQLGDYQECRIRDLHRQVDRYMAE